MAPFPSRRCGRKAGILPDGRASGVWRLERHIVRRSRSWTNPGASSWQRPFPVHGARGLRLPQPDGILLLAGGDGPRRLVFLEHDRGTESLVSFARAKIDRYRALASRPGLLEELTGFRRFSVVVTVTGPGPAETDARTRALTRLIRSRFAAALLHVVPYENLLTPPDLVGAVGRRVPPPRQPDAPKPLSP